MCSFLLQFQCCRHNIFHIPLLRNFNVFRVHSKFPFFKRPFSMWPFSKSVLWICHRVEFLFFLLLQFLGLGHVASQLPNQGSNAHLPTLESKVLTTRPPGEFPISYFLSLILSFSDFTDQYYLSFPHAVALQIAVFQIRHSFSLLINWVLLYNHWFLAGPFFSNFLTGCFAQRFFPPDIFWLFLKYILFRNMGGFVVYYNDSPRPPSSSSSSYFLSLFWRLSLIWQHTPVEFSKSNIRYCYFFTRTMRVP